MYIDKDNVLKCLKIYTIVILFIVRNIIKVRIVK